MISCIEVLFLQKIINCDAPSRHRSTSEKVLSDNEKRKKKKYLQACLDQRMHFTPLVFSTDGMMGRETKAFLKRLSHHLTARWRRPKVVSYINVRMSIACVRATHRTLRGSRQPVRDRSYPVPTFEDGAGIALMM